MQSFNIKQLAKQLGRVVAFTILINYPTAAATTVILSSYSVSTILANYSVSTALFYCAGSILLLDLLNLLCHPTVFTNLF